MLIIKVYVTKKVENLGMPDLELIDELRIQNIGRRDEELWEYEITKPDNVAGKIIHKRDEGYRPLLRKVLSVLGVFKTPVIDQAPDVKKDTDDEWYKNRAKARNGGE